MSTENLTLWILDSGLSLSSEFPVGTFRNYEWDWEKFHTDLIKGLANGSAPDLIEVGNTWTSRLAQEGVLLNITQFATETLNVAHTFFPRTLYSCRHPFRIDQYYALPLLIDVRLLFYNLELLDTYLISHPNAFESWHNFEQMCLKLKEALPHRVIAWPLDGAGFHDILPWVWLVGGDFVSLSREILVDSERTVEGIFRLASLILSDCAPIPPDPQGFGGIGRVRNQFSSGRIGMMAGAYWMKDEYSWHKRFKAVQHPPDLYPAAFVGGSNVAIIRKHGDDETVEAYRPAKELLQKMIGVDMQLELAEIAGKLPCNILAWKKMKKEASGETKELLETFNDALSYTVDRGIPNLPNSVQVEEALKSCIETIWKKVGEIKHASPRASMEELAPKCREMIKNELGKTKKTIETFIIGYTIQYTSREVAEMGLRPPGQFDLWVEVTSKNPPKGRVYTAGTTEEKKVTPTLFHILYTLIKAPQRKLKLESLLQEVWGRQSRSEYKQIIGLIPWARESFELLDLLKMSLDVTPAELKHILEQHRRSVPYSQLIAQLEKRNQWPEFTKNQCQRLICDVIAEGREIVKYGIDQTAIGTVSRQFTELRTALGEIRGKQLIFHEKEDEDHFFWVEDDLSICLVTS